MSIRPFLPVHSSTLALVFVVVCWTPVFAQGAIAYGQSLQQQDAPGAHQQDHGENMPTSREGSGTAWVPDTTPMYAIHAQRGAWLLMFHENAFLQFLNDSSDRGANQLGSINWIMGVAQRPVNRGRLLVRGMLSAEPWTIRGCGYPD